jgi:hypothetical protein
VEGGISRGIMKIPVKITSLIYKSVIWEITAVSRQNLIFYWGMLDMKKVYPYCFLSYMMSPWTVYLSPPCSQICLNQIAGPRHIAHCTGLGPSLHSSSTITKIQLNTSPTPGGGGDHQNYICN